LGVLLEGIEVERARQRKKTSQFKPGTATAGPGRGIKIKLFQHHTREFSDPLTEKEFVIEVNLKRRHLNEFQRGELGVLLEGIETERAKRRIKEHQFKPGKDERRWKKAAIGKDKDKDKDNSKLLAVLPGRQPGMPSREGTVSHYIAKRV